MCLNLAENRISFCELYTHSLEAPNAAKLRLNPEIDPLKKSSSFRIVPKKEEEVAIATSHVPSGNRGFLFGYIICPLN